MLNIRRMDHLCRPLKSTYGHLQQTLENFDTFVNCLVRIDPRKPDKPRDVIDVWGTARDLQNRLYKNVLLPKLWPSEFSHCGVGCSIKTSALVHQNSHFVFQTDISNFYPSIHRKRVYRLFIEMGCSPNVARAMTRLCTYENHLALGLVTSPILADRILNTVDTRLGSICTNAGLKYSRFVDDITFSGPFDFLTSGFPDLVGKVLSEHGLELNREKSKFGRLDSNTDITGVRVINGKLDVRLEYAEELCRQLSDAKSLASDELFEGPFYTKNQIRGRVEFVAWINPGRGWHLRKKFHSISWKRHKQTGIQRKLVAAKIRTVRRTNPEPSKVSQEAIG